MNSQRHVHAASLLPDGRILVTGGQDGTGTLASAEVYSPLAGTWTATAAMTSARYYHGANLLADGKVLVTGGYSGSVALATAELYDPATGTWTSAGTMASARYLHAATLLPDGKVLVTGGYRASAVLATAELYDPATGTWTSAGTMASVRYHHAATLLPDGKVLVTGGYNGAVSLATAELYDPATGTWTSAGSMGSPRYSHSATLLPDGKVLVAGGYNGAVLTTAELYDPSTGAWTSAGSMASGHYQHAAVRLPQGKVLVIGGYATTPVAAAELYDPVTGTWSSAGPMSSARVYLSAILLPDGRALAIGGYNGSVALATTELYDPAAGTWTATGATASAHGDSTATLLPNGKVLIAGGTHAVGMTASTELYEPSTGTWTATSAMISARGHHSATLLRTGQLLVAGGAAGSSVLSTTELYDPAAGAWASLSPMVSPRTAHRASLLPDGTVLVTGGANGLRVLATAELYDPASAAWKATSPMAAPRSQHTSTPLPTGKVLISGGATGGATLAAAELYDPATGAWTATGSMSSARHQHTATSLPDGRVLVTGGSNGSTPLATAELYDPTAGTWKATGSMSSGRHQHTATLLPDGKVLVTGGSNGSILLATAELYDPATGTWKVLASMNWARQAHAAVLLPSSRVLVTGGASATAELYDDLGTNEAWRPKPNAPGPLVPGVAFTLTGTGFRGPSGGCGDSYRCGASDVPRLLLLSPEGGGYVPLSWQRFSDTEVRVTLPPVGYGHYLLFVSTHAIASGQPVRVVDSTAPDTSLSTVPPLQAREPRADFSLSSPDTDTVSYECGLDEAPFVPCSSTPSFERLPDGTHTLAVRAIDASGNADTSPAIHSWTVDTMAPAAPLLRTPTLDATVRTLMPTFSGTAEAGSTVTVFVDGRQEGMATATEGAWSFTLPRELAMGAHAVEATATDAAGNTGPASESARFIIRGSYGWGCATLPASGVVPWALASLALALHRRRRSGPPSPLRQGSRALLPLLVLATVLGSAGREALASPLEQTSYPSTKNPHIRKAARLYDELEYEASLKSLREAETFAGNGPEETLWMVLMKGILHHSLRNDQEADEAFALALTQRPSAQLPVPLPSQTLQERFERVRRKLRAAQAVSEPSSTQPAAQEPPARPWSLMVGLRGEAEVVRFAVVPSLMAELAQAPMEGAGSGFGGALTVVLQSSPVLRAEGRLYPYDIQGASLGWIRPHVLLGVTALVPEGSVGGRAGVGVGLQTGAFRLFADVAYERFLNATAGRQSDALLFSLGAGWSPLTPLR
ncbi:MAG TPA: kelch repeat-containing protein [Archangium sp.]|uniref:kelch repeat-containing protein n=1 Tax=Archangium sp. TaxID=1872627 RepID=UPI002E34B97B|nr:kelch repeat-containing protein [Archangium sp.]HEX5752830.1 kelch repeat-containing protein [Archangium sp.]